MATQTQWLLVDDIDGSRPATTVEFGIDGEHYAIDLSAEHAAQLRAVVGEFIAAARVRHATPAAATPAAALRHAPPPRTTVTAPATANPPRTAPPSLRAELVDVVHSVRAEARRALFEILTALLDVLRGRLAARRLSGGATTAADGGA